MPTPDARIEFNPRAVNARRVQIVAMTTLALFVPVFFTGSRLIWGSRFLGITVHLRVAVLCLLGVNAAAAILVWFGSGWTRLGLTVAAYWICFLWFFPLALRE